MKKSLSYLRTNSYVISSKICNYIKYKTTLIAVYNIYQTKLPYVIRASFNIKNYEKGAVDKHCKGSAMIMRWHFPDFCTIYMHFIYNKDKKGHIIKIETLVNPFVCERIDQENGVIFGVPLRDTWTLVSSIQRYRHFSLKLSSAFLFFELSARALQQIPWKVLLRIKFEG